MTRATYWYLATSNVQIGREKWTIKFYTYQYEAIINIGNMKLSWNTVYDDDDMTVLNISKAVTEIQFLLSKFIYFERTQKYFK